MIRERIQPVLDLIRRAITEPRSELDRWEKALRFAHDLGKSGARQLRRDRAPQMAGALTFRTLFGLLPVLVMGALVLSAMRGTDAFVDLVETGIVAAELDAVGTAGNTLGDLLRELVGRAADYNTAAIGWVGLAVLIYSALSLMVTIENSFNTIYRAPEGRRWVKRLPIYWAILTLGPVAVGLSVYVNSRVAVWIESMTTWNWLLTLGAAVWTFVVAWLLLVAVYTLVPNTSIKLRSAAIGAFVAAVLLGIGQGALGAYLTNAVSITQFGGSLGLVPLFMFWIYVMWLVVLFGLEVSATLQTLAGRSLEELEPKRGENGLVDPAAILSVMEVVARRFRDAMPTTPRQVVDAAGLPEQTVRRMLDGLIEDGLLHRLEGDLGAVSLSRPPEGIGADELIEVGFSLVDAGSGAASTILVRLREAQRALAAQAKLIELLPPQPVAEIADQVSPRE